MKISVIIPLYNKVRYIRRAIDSVLAQKHQDFEVIVVDDGSTDGGGDVVREVRDPRLRLIVQKNAGESAARNRGIREALCEMIAFLDADDEWLPCFLKTVINLRNGYPDAGMYGSAYCFCNGKTTWSPVFTGCISSAQGGLLDDYFRAALGPSPVTSSSVMIPKRVLDEIGGFPAGIRRGGDLQTWARIALRYRVAWSPVPGAIYHLSADNRACLGFPVELDPKFVFIVGVEEFLQSGYKTVSPRRSVEEYCISVRLNYAKQCYLAGKRTWALYNLDKARNTTMFRKERLLLRVAIWFPHSLTKILIKLKNRIMLLPCVLWTLS